MFLQEQKTVWYSKNTAVHDIRESWIWTQVFLAATWATAGVVRTMPSVCDAFVQRRSCSEATWCGVGKHCQDPLESCPAWFCTNDRRYAFGSPSFSADSHTCSGHAPTRSCGLAVYETVPMWKFFKEKTHIWNIIKCFSFLYSAQTVMRLKETYLLIPRIENVHPTPNYFRIYQLVKVFFFLT